MRFLLVVLALSLASCAAVPAAPARAADDFGDHFHVHLLLAARELDDDWEPVEEQFGLGIEFAGRPGESPVGWEFGVSGSSEEKSVSVGGDSFDFTGSFVELYGGARFWLADSDAPVLPYLGLGLSVINAEAEGDDGFTSTSDDDTSPGLYFHGGLSFPLGPSFRLGLDARAVVGTEIEVFGVDSDADYRQIAFVLGWSW